MAINAIQTATDLILQMDNGMGASGQQLSIARTYQDVKPSAENADIYDIAKSLLSLQEKSNISIQVRGILEFEEE